MSENQTGFDGSRPSVLDAAIDRAVRQMVQVDPPSGLRRRVLSRLTAPAARGGARMRYVAFATLGILVLAVGLLVRDKTPVPTEVSPTTVQEAGKQQADAPRTAERLYQRGALPGPGARAPRPAPARARPRPAPHAEVIPMPEITNVFGPPANTITGASVFARETDSRGSLAETVSASPIEIQLLTIAPLEIEPLRIPEIPTAERRR
jgi:hypothetical protein